MGRGNSDYFEPQNHFTIPFSLTQMEISFWADFEYNEIIAIKVFISYKSSIVLDLQVLILAPTRPHGMIKVHDMKISEFRGNIKESCFLILIPTRPQLNSRAFSSLKSYLFYTTSIQHHSAGSYGQKISIG